MLFVFHTYTYVSRMSTSMFQCRILRVTFVIFVLCILNKKASHGSWMQLRIIHQLQAPLFFLTLENKLTNIMMPRGDFTGATVMHYDREINVPDKFWWVGTSPLITQFKSLITSINCFNFFSPSND